MFGTGFLLAGVRLIDPYYRYELKSTVYEYFGLTLKSKTEGIFAKPLNSYLAESLNVELINIILQGITRFSEPDWTEIKSDLNRRNTISTIKASDLGEF